MKFIDLQFKPAFINEGPPFYTSGVQTLVKLENGITVSIVMHTGSYGGKNGQYEMMITETISDEPLGGIVDGVQEDGIIGFLSAHDVETILTKLETMPPLSDSKIIPFRKEINDA